MRKSVAYIPELEYERNLTRDIALSDSLTLLRKNHPRSVELVNDLTAKGYDIEGGVFIYFEGNLGENETVYEVFQSYCLAVTFFYTFGRATCRAYLDIQGGPGIEVTEAFLFIDEYDEFRIDPDDLITLQYGDIKKISPVFPKVLEQLTVNKFNSLANAIEFYVLFQSEAQIRTRLLYLSICLEGVLIDGAEEGISYKLGMRCAHLIANEEKEISKEEIYSEVKNIYNLRSKIIHGSDYQKASNQIIRRQTATSNSELDHILILEKIVKEVFSTIFYSTELYKSTIENKLGITLDELILTEGQ